MPTLLLVEDNPDIRRLVDRALKGAGYDVTSTPDGKAALRLLETTTFDIVLTDIVMPEMDGLELIRAVRKSNKATRIIGMSGGGRGSSENYLTLAENFGAESTLQKPFTIEELLAKVGGPATP
jgi:DNA-binding response OmpR family regulator